MSDITVPVADLRRVLAAVDTAASLDGEMLSGSQERSWVLLRTRMREAGHLCLTLAVNDCPVCAEAVV